MMLPSEVNYGLMSEKVGEEGLYGGKKTSFGKDDQMSERKEK